MGDFNDQEFFIFDVETTGLSPFLGDRIIEIACLKVRGSLVIDQFQSLIDPGRPISLGAFMVNGITETMLIEAPKACEVLPRIAQLIDQSCLVGHNVQFDLKFLNHEFRLAGLRPLENVFVIDTAKMARNLLPGLGSYKLDQLVISLNIQHIKMHRAMADVKATFELFCRLWQIAQGKKLSLENMIRLFGLSPFSVENRGRNL